LEIYYGTEGWLEISGDSWKAFRRREREPFAGSKDDGVKQTSDHFTNFVDAVRAEKNEVLHCDINEGFYSSCLPLLGNISYRVGREVRFMNEYEKFINDPEADAHLTRVYRKPFVVPDIV